MLAEACFVSEDRHPMLKKVLEQCKHYLKWHARHDVCCSVDNLPASITGCKPHQHLYGSAAEHKMESCTCLLSQKVVS